MDEVRKALKPYVHIMNLLIEGRITAYQFQVEYLTMFKNETERIGGEEFDIMQRLFAETDEYTADPELRREAGGVDEEELRGWVERNRACLLALGRASN
jgi:hypothetical protein